MYTCQCTTSTNICISFCEKIAKKILTNYFKYSISLLFCFQKMLEYNYKRARSSSKYRSSICCWKSHILSLDLFFLCVKTRLCTKLLLLLSLNNYFQLPLFLSIPFIKASKISSNSCQPNENDNLPNGENNFPELS